MAHSSRCDLPERYLAVLRALTDACCAEPVEEVPARPVAERADLTVRSTMGRLFALRERSYVSSRRRERAGPIHWAPTTKARSRLGR